MLNLNHNCEMFLLKEIPCGKTQNIEIKIGKKIYLIDVEKNNNFAYVEVFKKLSNDRKSFSKYDAEAKLKAVTLKGNEMLNRNFFENFGAIAEAQRTLRKFNLI